MPIREYSKWNERPTDYQEEQDPYRRYFFLCEGAKTEQFYFEALIDYRKELGIHPLIDVRYLEKTEEDANLSDPMRITEMAIIKKEELDFDEGFDVLVVVFDADVFEFKKNNYDEVIRLARDNQLVPGVTNPCFELFLLFHIPNSYEDHIKPIEDKLLLKENLGSHSLLPRLLSDIIGISPKHNPEIGKLAKDVRVAIDQCEKINNDIDKCKGVPTCNLGIIINMILNDRPI